MTISYRIQQSTGGVWTPMTWDAVPSSAMLYLSEAITMMHDRTWMDQITFTIPQCGHYRITKCLTPSNPQSAG